MSRDYSFLVAVVTVVSRYCLDLKRTTNSTQPIESYRIKKKKKKKNGKRNAQPARIESTWSHRKLPVGWKIFSFIESVHSWIIMTIHYSYSILYHMASLRIFFTFFFFLILLTEGDAWSVLRCAMWGGKSGAERRRRRRRRMPTVPGGKTPVRRRLPNWEDVRRSLKIRNQFSPLSQYRVGRSVYSRQSRTSESLLCVPEVELTLDVYRERIIERESIFFCSPVQRTESKNWKKRDGEKEDDGSPASSWWWVII